MQQSTHDFKKPHSFPKWSLLNVFYCIVFQVRELCIGVICSYFMLRFCPVWIESQHLLNPSTLHRHQAAYDNCNDMEICVISLGDKNQRCC